MSAPSVAVSAGPSPSDVRIISDLAAAAILLKDPRRRILEMARTPITAVEIADRLAEPRQRVGYHVRRLVDAGLLEDVGVSRRGAVVEKRYRASAERYALAPELLGSLAARLDSKADRESLAYLAGAVHEVQSDLVRVLSGRPDAAAPLPTLTLSSRLRFESASQRGAFADALVRALADVVAKHASAFTDADGRPSPGEPFRLTLTLHPTRP